MSFPVENRTLASSISSLAIVIGGVLGTFFPLLFCTVFKKDDIDIVPTSDYDKYRSEVTKFITVDLIIAGVTFVIILFAF